ncbi:hypothetical protein DPV78_006954 [Talaromyces pinophilus]|nr:hypothetical protein DPV78_006954 [Talaromyces pinophilus]
MKQGLVKALILINEVAKSNFIIIAEAVNRHKIATYRKAILDVIMPDSGDMVRKTLLSYYVVDIIKYDLILGVLWHVIANLDIF